MTADAANPRFFLGWTVVAVALLAAFTQVAFFNPTLGVFIPEFERDFGWSRTEISFGVTLGSFVGAGTAPLFGPLIDRYGGRRFVVGGAALMAGCLVLFSMMQAEWQFLFLYAIGRGTASGLLALATGVTVSKWFVRRRGLAIGVMSLGTRLGFALMPIGVQLIIQAADWRTAALGLAATVAVFGILPSLFYLHPRPEAQGLLPDGDSEPRTGSDRPVRQDEYSWSRQDALQTRAFWLVTFAVSLMSLTGGAVNLHQIPHLVDRGLSPETAALVITVVAVFGGIGVIAEGILDERVGARWTMAIGLVGSSAGVTVLILVHSLAMALLFAVVNGLFFGLLVASNQVVFADYFGRNALGAIRGYSQPFQLGTNAFGPIIAGAAHDITGSYVAAFAPFAFCYLVAAFALVIAKKPRPPETAASGRWVGHS
ncbi:MAG TPA: MFS transporter [Dehalococcoidia bacterium]|nr:MFS transporter [Dehalococcoidia bacterium]